MKLYNVKKSNIDKRGLYASKNIKAGDKIIEYVGKLISKKETESNPKFDNERDIYLFKRLVLREPLVLVVLWTGSGSA